MFEIEEGGSTKYYYLTRKADGREFIYMRFYDAELDCFDDEVIADDNKPITKEEKEEVKRAIRKFLGEEEEPEERRREKERREPDKNRDRANMLYSCYLGCSIC